MNGLLDENQLKYLCVKFSHLTKAEFFIAGLCAGITTVNADIILRFLEKATKIQDEVTKKDFYVSIANGHLGKAKAFLTRQLNKPLIPKKSSHPQMNCCKICKKTTNDKEIEYLDGCADLFHKECIKEHIQKQISENQYPVKCPECGAEVSSVFIKLKVGDEYYEKYSCSEISHAVEVIECPIEGCKSPIAFNVQLNKIKVKCTECDNSICLNCGVKFHEGLTCEDYVSSKNPRCQYCKLVIGTHAGTHNCKCARIVCGKCSLPTNLCKCEFKKISL